MACYGVYSGKTELIRHIYPCGPVNATTPHVPCCNAGETCIPGGLCEYTHSQPAGSGFYAAGCTDPSFQDPSCRRLCQKRYRPDVMYSASSQTWACCSSGADGSPDCTQQSNETFNLAPPQELRAFFSIPPSGFQYTSVVIQPSSSATSSAPSTTSSNPPIAGGGDTSSSSSLSPSATAGIGVGAGAAVLLFGVAGLATWYLQRKRRRAIKEQRETFPPSYQKNTQTSGSTSSTRQEEELVKPELNDQCLPREMPGEMIREMPA